jgi:hypothetical protein
LKILGVLRVLGEGYCFDGIEELNSAIAEVDRLFFHRFCALFSLELFDENCSPPTTNIEIKKAMNVYTRLGLPGSLLMLMISFSLISFSLCSMSDIFFAGFFAWEPVAGPLLDLFEQLSYTLISKQQLWRNSLLVNLLEEENSLWLIGTHAVLQKKIPF